MSGPKVIFNAEQAEAELVALEALPPAQILMRLHVLAFLLGMARRGMQHPCFSEAAPHREKMDRMLTDLETLIPPEAKEVHRQLRAIRDDKWWH